MATVSVSRTQQALHLRVDHHGVIERCSDGTADWLALLGCTVGRRAPVELQHLVEQAATDGVVAGRVPCGHDQLDVMVVPNNGGCDVYGADRTVDPDPFQVTWSNPNPVLRVDLEGQVLYANPASEPLLRSWGVLTGDRLPEAWVSALRQISPGDRRELVAGGGFAVTVCPQGDRETVHLYGRKLG
jgi:hypothetical protein